MTTMIRETGNAMCLQANNATETKRGVNSLRSYFHHILSAPILSRNCIWQVEDSGTSSESENRRLEDITDGDMFRNICKSHNLTDDEGRPVYHSIAVVYQDSMTATKLQSNTLGVVFCGNLDRRLRNLTEFACPLWLYRGQHTDFYKAIAVVIEEIQQREVRI